MVQIAGLVARRIFCTLSDRAASIAGGAVRLDPVRKSGGCVFAGGRADKSATG